MRWTATALGGLLALILLPLLLLAAVLTGTATTGRTGALNPAAIPRLAAAHLATITTTIATACPELPPAWVIAHVQAESGWNPAAFSSDVNGGAAGLYQLNQENWRAAGGAAWPTSPPPGDADVLQPDLHLRLAIPWICTNLRTVTAHLRATGKPTTPLDAMLVCHIAGCGRVTGSATGTPAAGEAGCDATCADLIHRYIDRIHGLVAQYSAADNGTSATPPGPDDRRAGCTAPDPTGGRCLTPATRHAHDEIIRVFGPPGPRSTIHSAGCWDAHAWNPTSDHARGRACDYFPTTAGRFPRGDELSNGWRLANWLRTNAQTLDVAYVIWQGRIWSPGSPDQDGWGRPYTGGGIYDPRDATGGHYDHVHLSIRR